VGENVDALVWRAQEPDTNGQAVTVEALKQMADGLRPGSVISNNFDFRQKIGYVVQAWIDGHDLYVTATFDDESLVELLRQGKLAVRPGFSIEEAHQNEDGLTVVDTVGVTHVAVTPDPMPLPGDLSAEQFPDGCVGEHKAGSCPEWSA
jgi:hypothetical protein